MKRLDLDSPGIDPVVLPSPRTSEAAKDFVAGTIGGWAQVVAGHPFDTLKVRLQTQPTPAIYKNSVDCARKTVKAEGVAGLYKGAASPLLGVGFCNALLFATNGTFRRFLSETGNERDLTIGQHMTAGALSGVVIAWLNCPLELVKIKMQTQSVPVGSGSVAAMGSVVPAGKYKGVIDCSLQIFHRQGIKGLYRGMATCFVRDVPSYAAYFGAYEYTKLLFHRHSSSSSSSQHQLTATQLIISGGLAGIAAWAPCYPIDVIKSRIQSYDHSHGNKKMKAMDHAREIWRVDGWRGFFRGFGPTVLRAFPANAATFLVYEMVMDAFR